MATDTPGDIPTGTDPTGADPASGSTDTRDTGVAEDRPVRLTLLTRTQCHLCDVAKQALARVAEQAGQRWREVDVDSDPTLQAEFWDRVPVVLLDGREHGYWRVDEERLLRDLQQPPAQ